jgi:single-strand DNA-binding protein
VDQEERDIGSGLPPSLPAIKEHIMAFVRVEQRNARLAAVVRIDVVQGRDGPVSKGTAVAIANIRKQGGEEEATAIQWTLWGKQAESAAEYLGKGSRVNIVGRVQNNNYENADRVMVYGLTFTCEEIDYLDSKADVEARRAKESGEVPATTAEPHGKAGKVNGHTRRQVKAAEAAAADDIPF